MTEALGTCAELARKLGVDAQLLRKQLGLKSTRKRVTRDDIRDALWDDLLDLARDTKYAVRMARFIGERSGPYVELFWLAEGDWFFYPKAPPRIFAVETPRDRDDERDVVDLLKLRKRTRSLGALDSARRRALRAIAIALRAMRPIERDVLLTRLGGKRGSESTTWRSVADECDLHAVALAKEVYKAAVREFLGEYARVSRLLIDDPDYGKRRRSLTISD